MAVQISLYLFIIATQGLFKVIAALDTSVSGPIHIHMGLILPCYLVMLHI